VVVRRRWLVALVAATVVLALAPVGDVSAVGPAAPTPPLRVVLDVPAGTVWLVGLATDGHLEPAAPAGSRQRLLRVWLPQEQPGVRSSARAIGSAVTVCLRISADDLAGLTGPARPIRLAYQDRPWHWAEVAAVLDPDRGSLTARITRFRAG
jgi:hypothetical protein